MKAITKILLLVAVMAVFIMLPMKVQAATYDVSTLVDLKTVIASVDSGDTVNITGDITLDSDLTITNPNAFTITSNSGRTIACGSYKIVIGAGADVTVGGDLAITGTALSTISVQNGGRFTLAGGTVENTNTNTDGSAIESEGNAVISDGAIEATGSSGVGVRALGGGVTISGGTISTTGISSIGVYAGNNASVTINGGTVSSEGTGVRVANTASVTINSGAVSASGAGVMLHGNNASVTINGGTVSAIGETGIGVQVNMGTAHISGGDISGAGKGVNLASGQVNITVSGGLSVSGGVFASTGSSFLSNLPLPATVTAGQTGQVALAGVDESITFAIDPATAGELAASIDDSNKVTLQPDPATPVGGYELVLTAQSGSGNLKLTVPVSVVLPDISGDFTDTNFKQAVWEWLGNPAGSTPGSFTKQDLIGRMPAKNYRLIVESKNIASLAGLEHFQGTGIKELACGYNQLTSLPQLPSGLEVLECNNNQLEVLPALPNTLTNLECYENRLTTLPDLPSGLRLLKCHLNFINVFSGAEKDKLDACQANTKAVTPQYRYAYTGTGLAFTSAGETQAIQAAEVVKESSDDGNTWTQTYEQTDFGLFSFASSDTGVATVDVQGVVTAVGNGTCEIYARFADIASAYTQAVIPVNVAIPIPPSITTQPISQTVLKGDSVTFTVEATGDEPLSYQWKKSDDNLTDGGNISGATTATLTISNVQETDAGIYRVEITNTAGSVTSEVVTLTVKDLTSGLVLHLNFENNLYDDSGNGNNGSAIENLSYVDGVSGKAVQFGGIDKPGCIKVPDSNSLHFGGELTVSFYARLDSEKGVDANRNTVDQGRHCLFSKNDDRDGHMYAILLTDTKNLTFVSGGSYVFANAAYNLGEWMRITITVSSNKLVVYKNKEKVREETMSKPWSFAASDGCDLYIGGLGGTSWYPFYGAIDDFRLYNRALAEDEVQLLVADDEAVSFKVSAPDAVKVGKTFRVQLTALNSSGQLNPLYSGTHTINWTWTATNSPDGTPPVKPADGPVSFVSGTAIVNGFMLTKSGEDVTISATDESGVTGTSDPIAVNPGTVMTGVTIETPATINVGEPFGAEVTIAISDYGNSFGTSVHTGTIGFAGDDTQVNLPERYTFTESDNNTKAFQDLVFYEGRGRTLWVSEVTGEMPDGYWRFDEGRGNVVVDFSGNRDNGTLTGSTRIEGAPGIAFDNSGGLRFNGANNYVITGNGIDLRNRSFTIAFWAKRIKSGDQWIVSQGTDNNNQGLHVGFRDNTTFSFAFWYNDLDVNVSVDNDWHHWAVTFDIGDKSQRVYRDGVLLGIRQASSNLLSSGPLYFGKRFDNAGYFGGDLDDLRVYCRALPGDEIAELAAGGGAVRSWSVTLGLPPTAPQLLRSHTNLTGTVITLTFDQIMADPAGKQGQFSATVNGEPRNFIAAALHPDNPAQIDLTLTDRIYLGDQVTVSYTAGDVASSEGGLLGSFTGQAVVNFVPGKRLIAGGDGHSLALLADGTVIAWGDNSRNQCNVPAGLTNVVAIAKGDYHSMALKSDGTVVAWGYNGKKQSNVPADLTNVSALAAGEGFSMALKADGTIVAWGDDASNAPSGLKDVVAIDANGNQILMLKADGTVVTGWSNNNGNIPLDLSDVIAVAAGGAHSLALKSDGTVVAWGHNNKGQCRVPEGLKNVVAIAAGGYHSMALKSDGTVEVWGDFTQGQRDVPTGLTNVVAIAAGWFHNLALKSDGSVVAWGDNRNDRCNVPEGLNLSGRLSRNQSSQYDALFPAGYHGLYHVHRPDEFGRNHSNAGRQS